jgi:hypothetical protein
MPRDTGTTFTWTPNLHSEVDLVCVPDNTLAFLPDDSVVLWSDKVLYSSSNEIVPSLEDNAVDFADPNILSGASDTTDTLVAVGTSITSLKIK